MPVPAAPLTYDFLAPGKIAFGWGRRGEVGTLARALGQRAFIVCGSRTLEAGGRLAEIESSLRAAGVEPLRLATQTREPEVPDVDAAARSLRQHGAGQGALVLAVGGGSALDLGKAAAAMATNVGSDTVKDYLEGVGCGLQLDAAPLPVLAMPTTGGTGTEATKNAVISGYNPPFKKSLRSERMVPRIVLVDPELSVSLPAATTAWTGMDAITQLIESYLCRAARPLPRALALEGLARALPALQVAVNNPQDRAAREAMSHAALLSGMALANAGLGMAHGVAAALGACARVPHGLACAMMLPVALRANRTAREADMAGLARLLLASRETSDAAAADEWVGHIQALCDAVDVPRRLSQMGVRREQIPQLVAASKGNSMTGNPREIGDQELARLLEEIW